MKNKLFEIQDIITIVMAQISNLEEHEYFGEAIEEDIHFPKYIQDKFKKLDNDTYKTLMDKCIVIAKEVRELKSGELNELNFIHGEIVYLAKDTLKDFIIN